MKLAAILALVLLSGCATPDTVYLFRCPPLVSYTPDIQSRAADELEALPPDAVLPGMIADYGRLRKQCRSIGPQTKMGRSPHPTDYVLSVTSRRSTGLTQLNHN